MGYLPSDDEFDPDAYAKKLLGEADTSTPTKQITIHRPAVESDKEFRDFFKKQGFNVNRTYGKAINKGSPHTYGGAADINIHGKTSDDLYNLMEQSLLKGYRVFDERQPAPGVRQTGPHIHVENAKTTLKKPSRFVNQGLSAEQIQRLTDLDNQRRGSKPSFDPNAYAQGLLGDTEFDADAYAQQLVDTPDIGDTPPQGTVAVPPPNEVQQRFIEWAKLNNRPADKTAVAEFQQILNDEVAQENRVGELEQIGEAAKKGERVLEMPDAPITQATDADFEEANKYLASIKQPLLTREQFNVAQKGGQAQATGYQTRTGAESNKAVSAQPERKVAQTVRNPQETGYRDGSLSGVTTVPIDSIPTENIDNFLSRQALADAARRQGLGGEAVDAFLASRGGNILQTGNQPYTAEEIADYKAKGTKNIQVSFDKALEDDFRQFTTNYLEAKNKDAVEQASRQQLRQEVDNKNIGTDGQLSWTDPNTWKMAWDKIASGDWSGTISEADRKDAIDNAVNEQIKQAGSAEERLKLNKEYENLSTFEKGMAHVGDITHTILRSPASFAKTVQWAEDTLEYLHEKGIPIPTLTTSEIINAFDWMVSKTLGLPESKVKPGALPKLYADVIEGMHPDDKRTANTMMGKIARGTGSAVPFLLGAMATGGGSVATALLGAGMQVGEMYDTAQKEKLSREKQLLSGAIGIPIGASEAWGLKWAKLGELINKGSKGVFLKSFTAWLKETGKDATEEALQEFFQSTASKLTVTALKNNGLTFKDVTNAIGDSVEDATVGGIVGALFGGGTPLAVKAAGKIKGPVTQARTEALLKTEPDAPKVIEPSDNSVFERPSEPKKPEIPKEELERQIKESTAEVTQGIPTEQPVKKGAKKTVEPVEKVVDAKSMARQLTSGHRLISLPMQDDVYNYTTPDGIEVSLTDDAEGGYVNGEQVQADVMIDVLHSPIDKRGQGLASKEFQRILDMADENNLSLSGIIDPEQAVQGVKGDKVGMSVDELRSWYKTKGFLVDPKGRYIYRPAKNEDAKYLQEQTYTAKEQEITPDVNVEDYSDLESLREDFAQGKLKTGQFYTDGGDGLFTVKDGALVRVNNFRYDYRYERDANDSVRGIATIVPIDVTPQTVKPVKKSVEITEEAPKKDIAKKFSNKPLQEIKAEGEVKYDGVDDFFAEEAPVKKGVEAKETSQPISVGTEMQGNKVPDVNEINDLLRSDSESQGQDWIGENGSFETPEKALAFATEVHDIFDSLPDRVPVYRAVAADEVSLDPYGIGESWSLDHNAAKEFGRRNLGKNTKIISALVPKENIDFEQSIRAYGNFSSLGDGDSEFEAYIAPNSKLEDVRVNEYATSRPLRANKALDANKPSVTEPMTEDVVGKPKNIDIKDTSVDAVTTLKQEKADAIQEIQDEVTSLEAQGEVIKARDLKSTIATVSKDWNKKIAEATPTIKAQKPVTSEPKVGDQVENIIGGWKGTIAQNADGDLVVKRGKEVWGDYSPANYVPARAISELDANIDSFKAARTIPTKTLVERTDINKQARIADNGVIALDTIEAMELARRVIGTDTQFYGLMTEPQHVTKALATLDKMIKHSPSPSLKKLRNLINRASKHDGTVIFAMSKESVPEEKAHRALYNLRVDERTHQIAPDVQKSIAESDVFKNAEKFHNDYAGKSVAEKVEEFAVKASLGQWNDLGITDAQSKRDAKGLAIDFYESFAQQNQGKLSAEEITNKLATEIAYAQEYKDSQNSRNEEKAKNADKDSPVESTEREKDRPDVKSGRDTSAENVGQKKSATPATLRGNLGNENITDNWYDPTSNAERKVIADDVLSKGTDEAVKWVEQQITDKNYDNGTATAVGIGVINQLGLENNIEAMNDLTKKVVQHTRSAAQTVQAVATASMWNPESAIAYAAMLKQKALGKDLSAKESVEALAIAKAMHASMAAEGISSAQQEEFERKLRDLTIEKTELEKALELANGEIKDLNLDLAEAKKQIEATPKTSTVRTPARKRINEIKKNLSEIQKRIDAKYTVKPNEPMAMAVRNEELDRDLIDATLVHLADNMLTQDDIEVKTFIHKLAKGQLSDTQIDAIHAVAVREIIGEKEPLTAEQMDAKAERDEKSRNRFSHYRAMRKFERENLIQDPYKMVKGEQPLNKFHTFIISAGKNGGYSDASILIAMARQVYTDTNKVIHEIAKHYPMTLQEEYKALRDADHLLKDARKELADANLRAKYGEDLTAEQLEYIRKDRINERNNRYEVSREAKNFYDSITKSTAQIKTETGINFRRTNILTGVKTHTVNLVGNTNEAAYSEAFRPIANLTDFITSKFTDERTIQGYSPKAVIDSFRSLVTQIPALKNAGKQSGLQAMKDIWRTGGDLVDMQRLQHSESILSRAYDQEKQGKRYKTAKAIDWYINHVYRTLGMEDAIFKVFAFTRAIHEEAKTRAEMEAKRLGKDKEWAKERRQHLIDNPSQVMIQHADDYAQFLTFQNDNAISTWWNSVKQHGWKTKAGVEIAVPFDRTPTNIVMRTLEKLPVTGLVASAYKGARIKLGKQKKFKLSKLGYVEDKDFRARYSAAVKADEATELKQLSPAEAAEHIEKAIDREWTRKQQAEFARTVANMAPGNVLFFTGALLASAGFLAGTMGYDDDDRPESKEYFKRRSEGIENRSIYIPKLGRYTLPKTTATDALVAGATFYEQMQMSKGDSLMRVMNGASEVLSETIFEQPLLRSTSDWARNVKKGKYGSMLGNIGSGFVPASGLMREVSEITDPESRSKSGFDENDKGKTSGAYLRQEARAFKNNMLGGLPIIRNYALNPQKDAYPKGSWLWRSANFLPGMNVLQPKPNAPSYQVPNKQHGSVQEMLDAPEMKSASTDDVVMLLKDTYDNPEDKKKVENFLRKKAQNARQAKTLTQKEVDNIKAVLPDFTITANDANVKKK